MEKGNSDDKTYGVTGNIAFLQASLARKRLIGCVLVLFILAGGGLFAAFNTVIRITSTDAFCLSCHEMKGNILPTIITIPFIKLIVPVSRWLAQIAIFQKNFFPEW